LKPETILFLRVKWKASTRRSRRRRRRKNL